MTTLAAAVLVPLGCARQDPERIGYFLSSPADLRMLGSVAFIEIHDSCGSPEVARGLTEEIFQAIQGKKLFHLDVMRETEPSCRDVPIEDRGPYDLHQMLAMRKSLGSDAVLFGSLVRSQPYPRMEVSLYLRLLDLKNGRVIWAVDHTWDTTDKETDARIRYFFRTQMREDYDPVRWRLALMSPRIFQKFVAWEIAETLKPSPRKREPIADRIEDDFSEN